MTMKKLTVTNKAFNIDQEIELYIEENHQRILKESVLSAASLAETTVTPKEFEHHRKMIKAQYDEVLHYVKKHFKGDVHRVTGNLLRKIADTEIESNEAWIIQLKEDVRLLKLDKNKILVNSHYKDYWKIIALEGAIFLADCGWNTFSFTVLGGSILVAIPGALVFGLAQAVFAYKIPSVLKKISDQRKRVLVAVALGIAMLPLIIVASLLRSAVAFGNGTLASVSTPSVILGAIFISVIQGAMLFAATFLAWYLPTDEEHKAYTEYKKLDTAVQTKTKQIEALEARNREIPLESMKSLMGKAERIQSGEIYEKFIQTLATQTDFAFIAEYNLRTRRDVPLLS